MFISSCLFLLNLSGVHLETRIGGGGAIVGAIAVHCEIGTSYGLVWDENLMNCLYVFWGVGTNAPIHLPN